MRRYAGREIILDDPALQAIRRGRFHGARKGVEFRLFEITTEVPICSVFAILRRPSEMGPILAVASVTRLSPRAVVEKCFREVGQGLPYFRYLVQRLRDWTPRNDFSDVATFDHHCMLYFKRPELVDPALSFLAQAELKVPLLQLPDHSTRRVLGDIHRCVELRAKHGFEVLVADITTPEIRDVGPHVVRVVVPGLTPRHGTHTGPYLASPRLYGGPYGAEWLSKGWQRTDGLNPQDHDPRPVRYGSGAAARRRRGLRRPHRAGGRGIHRPPGSRAEEPAAGRRSPRRADRERDRARRLLPAHWRKRR